jgi:hypothetical protein
MNARILQYLIVFFVVCSCSEDEKTDPTKSDALILGPDYRYCMCCGGYFIQIKGDTYRFFENELPAASLNLNAADLDFPIPVYVHWEPKEDACLGDEIVIKKISIIQATPF